MSERAVFLDRDGTLNRERGFVTDVGELEVLPGVPQALGLLRRAGFRCIVLTNQSGIARGLYDEARLARVHEALQARVGHALDAILHCPHHPLAAGHPYGTECACRKPAPGLLHEAVRLYPALDLARSFLVGDSARDLLPAAGTPLRTILVRSGKPWEEHLAELRRRASPPAHVAEDLPGAVAWILGGLDRECGTGR